MRPDTVNIRVCKDDIKAPPLVNELFDGGSHFIRKGHIHHQRNRFSTAFCQSTNRVLKLFLSSGKGAHTNPMIYEKFGRRYPDARARAGDQGDLTFQIFIGH
jgi:hypothetical protein